MERYIQTVEEREREIHTDSRRKRKRDKKTNN